MRIVILLGMMLTATGGHAQVIPTFTEETASAGITHSYTGEWEQIVGGGAASFDCNADARPDLVLAGGSSPTQLFINHSPTGGALAFAPVLSGLEQTGVAGAYPFDIDSDGILDVVLLRVGENLVMRGQGDCKFTAANADWGFDGGDGWSTALAATFEAGQSWPTLAIGNYIDRTQEAFPWGSCTENWLHRPGAQGFAAPEPLTPSYCALSMLFTDWNRSGTPSLRVSNDREYYKGGQEQLWHIEPGQPPRLYTEAEGWARLRIWGMGIASADLTDDGYPDYVLTSMADNKLQVLADPSKPIYQDQAFARGTIAQRPYTGGELKPSTAWHAQIEDVNNDALADIFIAKGNVWAMPDFAMADPNNLLLQRPDGSFIEAGETAGVASMLTARGAALADFNADGQLDLVVVNRNGPAQVWRNGGTAGHWVQLALHQPGVNRDAIGAIVEVRLGTRVFAREVTVGGGHAGGSLGWLHVGLGDADQAEVRVIWPGGTADAWQTLPADQHYDLAPGADPAVHVWPAP